MRDKDLRFELANFLRTRRQTLQPEQVGLPKPRSQRRTPGLRREDVAELSDISVTWYTWLEQGRPVQASPLVLNRLADVFQLDIAQREYLFALATPLLISQSLPPLEEVPPRIQCLLDALGTNPAYLLGSHFEILAWNQAATNVLCDFAKISSTELNALTFLFSDHMRALLVNWESHARYSVAAFRVSVSRKLNEPWCMSLVEELSERSTEFRAWWPQHEVQRRPDICKLDHPRLGLLVLEQTVLMLHENQDLRLIVYTPHPGTDSAVKLQRISTPLNM
jgi:transcriptional regulator with XRE-family HTH domain